MTSPDFSPLAEKYASARPGYPSELYAFLASLVTRRDLAWDCATGTGQAARDLAGYFRRVIATDISPEQIRHAVRTPGIEYRTCRAEESGLESKSVDLVTVAAAVHWFDIDAFASEVTRVLRPGGILAAWSYHVGHVDPPFDGIFRTLYWEILRPYFAPEVRYVDERYATLPLPGVPIETPVLTMEATWNFSQLKEFIHSWSGTRKFIEERGCDPVASISEELDSLWGGRERIRTVRWPLFFRISRLAE